MELPGSVTQMEHVYRSVTQTELTGSVTNRTYKVCDTNGTAYTESVTQMELTGSVKVART